MIAKPVVKPPANDNGASLEAIPGTSCAVCGKPHVVRFKPFCSARCANVDLNRWLTGGYAIPAEDQQGDEGEGER